MTDLFLCLNRQSLFSHTLFSWLNKQSYLQGKHSLVISYFFIYMWRTLPPFSTFKQCFGELYFSQRTACLFTSKYWNSEFPQNYTLCWATFKQCLKPDPGNCNVLEVVIVALMFVCLPHRFRHVVPSAQTSGSTAASTSAQDHRLSASSCQGCSLQRWDRDHIFIILSLTLLRCLYK